MNRFLRDERKIVSQRIIDSSQLAIQNIKNGHADQLHGFQPQER